MGEATLGFSRTEKEEIVRLYLGSGAEPEWPLCRHCGEDLKMDVRKTDLDGCELAVSCPGCANGFSWSSARPVEPWQSLHLNYFKERFESNERLRCPVDDCGVSAIELPGNEVEFRCPFCNRRGRVRSPRTSNMAPPEDMEPGKTPGLTSRQSSK